MASVSQGVGPVAFMTLAVGLGPLAIFIASFVNKRSSWKITKLDLACGAVSLLALLLWWLTSDSNLAIGFSIVSDFMAAVPTVIKSFQAPETESAGAYRNSVIHSVLTLLTIKQWTVGAAAFPLYILIICLVIYALIKLRVGPRLVRKT